MDSLIGWYGGKKQLIPHILPFPIHTTYVEIFGGSGIVLFEKIPSPIEVINDINSRLMNMWSAIKEDRRKFFDFCINEYGIDSRELFNYCKENVADNKIEDAARFYYINSHSFSQLNHSYHGLSFTGKEHWHKPYLNKLKNLDKICERLKHVQLENQDFRTLIRRCDRNGVLLYLDPPYFKGGELYQEMAGNETEWTMQDFEDLRELLTKLENAMFVLSIDNADFWLETMPHLYVKEVERVNAASQCVGGEKSRSIEYVIRNFDNSCTKMKKTKITSDMKL